MGGSRQRIDPSQKPGVGTSYTPYEINGSGGQEQELQPPVICGKCVSRWLIIRAVRKDGRLTKAFWQFPNLNGCATRTILSFVATHPCLVCGRQPAEAHHLKFSQPSALGRKVSDAYTVPLCALHHRDLHTTGNELAWWERKKIDPLPVATDLWNVSRGKPSTEDANLQPANR